MVTVDDKAIANPKREGVTNTFVGKQFSNIEEQIKEMKDRRDGNGVFCFAVYSTLNQTVRRTLLIFSEMMNLTKNSKVFAPETGIFS
jgi:hypothetical protein